MKVLTIKEPWASLIINGYKMYEFRSWKTKYRGKILIHAGMTLEKDMAERFSSYNLNYYKGEIIGEATLVDCILVDEEFNKKLRDINPLVYGKSNHVETYAWKLENICKYDQPIKVKGKLGLWNYEKQGDNMIDEYQKIKTPNQLLMFMDRINYGYLSKRSKVYLNNDGDWYLFEHADYENKGIYEFTSKEELLIFQMNNYISYLKTFNISDLELSKVILRKFERPKKHIDAKEYLDYVVNSEIVNI